MDSLTQIVLGSSVAAACVERGQRRKALILGGVLGLLPDLDVLIDYGNPVENFVNHRSFSHSLFVLVPFSFLLWLLLRRSWRVIRVSSHRWLLAILLALVTHPLLDAHTAYGTQLWWPLSVPPTMWSTLFIIDPLYTVPLLVGAVATALKPRLRVSGLLLGTGLALSSVYLGWSWLAKGMVERHVTANLDGGELADAPRFSTPTPLNTLVWRVIVMTNDGYKEGYDSVLARGPVRFRSYSSERQAVQAASDIWAVERLRWFSHGFLRATVEEDRLILSDLRMGQHANYVFSHIVARHQRGHWEAMAPVRVPTSFDVGVLEETWKHLWQARLRHPHQLDGNGLKRYPLSVAPTPTHGTSRRDG